MTSEAAEAAVRHAAEDAPRRGGALHRAGALRLDSAAGGEEAALGAHAAGLRLRAGDRGLPGGPHAGLARPGGHRGGPAPRRRVGPPLGGGATPLPPLQARRRRLARRREWKVFSVTQNNP